MRPAGQVTRLWRGQLSFVDVDASPRAIRGEPSSRVMRVRSPTSLSRRYPARHSWRKA